MKPLLYLILFVGIWGGTAFELYHFAKWQGVFIFVGFLVTSHLFTATMNREFPDGNAPPTHFNH